MDNRCDRCGTVRNVKRWSGPEARYLCTRHRLEVALTPENIAKMLKTLRPLRKEARR